MEWKSFDEKTVDSRFARYKKQRKEAEEYAKSIVKNVPANFTMLHLELLKNCICRAIDNKLSDLKSEIIVNLIDPLQ